MRSHFIKPLQASPPVATPRAAARKEAKRSRRRSVHTREQRALWLLLTLLALSLVFVAGAQASSTENLGWKVNGKALGEGETTAITAKAENTQIYNEGVLFRIECSKLELLSAKLVGAKAPAPGKGEGRIAYSGCVVPPTECKVSAVSKPLVMTTTYLTKAAAEKEEIATGLNGLLLAPKEGEVFIEFVVSRGTHGICPFEEPVAFVFKGSVIAKVLKGPTETTYNEEAQTHLIEASTLKTYFENEGGKTVEHVGAGLKYGETEATWSGKSSVSVAAGSKYNLAL